MPAAAARYEACNRATLEWLLARGTLGGFLDTKVQSITGADYGAADGLRGPGYTYGWIQGRGLEALVTFAEHYRTRDPGFAAQLDARAEPLYRRLSELQQRDGHAYFLYDPQMRPIRVAGEEILAQNPAGPIHTYADAFVAKGLFAAAARFDPEALPQRLAYLQAVIAAVEEGRFQMDESQPLSLQSVAAEKADFGPRMILLAAAGLMHRLAHGAETGFAERFIDHVLARHFDAESGLLRTVIGEDACNIGHAVEFCGFAFEHLMDRPEDPRLPRLVEVLLRALEVGLQGPGIALSVSAQSGARVAPYFPWWPMPEAMRACALGHRLTGDARLLAPWQRADAAFFENYWRGDRGFAYQTRTVEGPVDYVPATPDLDPGYHTGLSLLAAIHAIRA
jgi:hypothetical protein